MADSKTDSLLLMILRLGAFFCFAGWTWVHFYWQGPYGILVWHETTFELAEWLGISWEEFVGSGAHDGFVQKWLSRLWWLYLLCALLCLTVRKHAPIQMALLIGGSGLLTILSYAKYLGAQSQLPMFIEHGGQMLSPILLVTSLTLGVRHRLTVGLAIIALIMTFVGHGTYALGLYWPTPAIFFGMTTVSLQIEYETARVFLRIAGIMDYVVCVGVLIPLLRIPCALYAVIWGLATALARPIAGMSTDLNYWGADQFLHEVVLRTPHFAIPLYLFLLWLNPEPAEQHEDKKFTNELSNSKSESNHDSKED